MTLHAVVDGPADAPPLVLGPSLGTTTAMWEPQLAALAARFRVVRFDHPGHGGSSSDPLSKSVGDIGARLLETMDQLGITRASYAGLSLGGMVGMWLAANAPERVDRLALLCTSAKLGTAQYWQHRAATIRADGMGAVVDAVTERWFTPQFHESELKVCERYRRLFCTIDVAGYAACCEAIAVMDLREDLAAISATTLVVAGADDTATPPEHGELIAAAIPRANLHVVANAAHLANVEQPAEVGALLVAHFTAEGD